MSLNVLRLLLPLSNNAKEKGHTNEAGQAEELYTYIKNYKARSV
jgi:hypothetical protein